MPKRTAVTAILLTGLFLSISARATVSVTLGSSDPDAIYFPGETIHLTVLVTVNGGETDTTLFGALFYPSALVSRTAAAQTAIGVSWSPNALICIAGPPTRCVTFNQTAFPNPSPNVTDFLIATADYSALAPGIADFFWGTTPSTQAFDFFGLTNAAGYSVTIVPEPTTAALLAIGLLSLAFAARRRA